MKFKTLMLLALVTLTFGFTKNVKAVTLDSEEQEFVNYLNEYRRTLGYTELKVSEPCTESAEWFATDAITYPDNVTVAHNDSRGETPGTRSDRYDYYFLSENLAWGYETAEEVLAAWQASDGHDDNMTLPELRTIGIARAYRAGATRSGALTEWAWVAVFGDAGVERLDGNELSESRLCSNRSTNAGCTNYEPALYKLDVEVKKRGGSGRKYYRIITEDVDDNDRDIDRDMTDTGGDARLYSYQPRKLKVSAENVLTGKSLSSKNVTLDEDKKVTFYIGGSSSSSSSSGKYRFRMVNSAGKYMGKMRVEIWSKGKFVKSRKTNSKTKVKFTKSSLKRAFKKKTGSKQNRTDTEVRFIKSGVVMGTYHVNLKEGKSFKFHY